MKFDNLFLFGNPEEYNAKRAAWAQMSEADQTFALGSQIRELGEKIDQLATTQAMHGQGLNVIAQLVGYESKSTTEGEAAEGEAAEGEAAAPAVDLPYPGEAASAEPPPAADVPHLVGQKIPGVVN